MKRREFIGLIGGAAMSPMAARAQQSASTKRIAIASTALKIADFGSDPNLLVFQRELSLRGYSEGVNLTIDRYSAEGRTASYGDLAREVVSSRPDVIVTTGAPLTLQFKAATSTIPIGNNNRRSHSSGNCIEHCATGRQHHGRQR